MFCSLCFPRISTHLLWSKCFYWVSSHSLDNSTLFVIVGTIKLLTSAPSVMNNFIFTMHSFQFRFNLKYDSCYFIFLGFKWCAQAVRRMRTSTNVSCNQHEAGHLRNISHYSPGPVKQRGLRIPSLWTFWSCVRQNQPLKLCLSIRSNSLMKPIQITCEKF